MPDDHVTGLKLQRGTERITIALSPVRLRDVLHAGPTTALPSEIDEVDDGTVTRSVCARLEPAVARPS